MENRKKKVFGRRRLALKVASWRAVVALASIVMGAHSRSASAQSQDRTAPPPPAPTTPDYSGDFWSRSTLTGDWGGARNWLADKGITLQPRLSQFYQGMPSGDGDHVFAYGGKADLLLNADLSKLGLWKGLSLTVHGEWNFGRSVNARGGTIVPVNTALAYPGLADADVSSLYLKQQFGDSVSLMVGKISMIDYAGHRPFTGGQGIDSFWSMAFAAPPSGAVPAYISGGILSVKTAAATFNLLVFDPTGAVNRAPFADAFAQGVTIRGTVNIPVTLAGRSGHQGFAASYSNMSGTDLDTLDTTNLELPPGSAGTKNGRYYANYAFDQYLYQSKDNPGEGVGICGQFGLSDGNPNPLYWFLFAGIGGTGLIPGRSRDNWGIGYYYADLSNALKESLKPKATLENEQGGELFYDFSVTPWWTLGADMQVIAPGLANETASFCGVRAVIRF